MQSTYRPEIFDATDMASAKEIILNPDGIHSTEERWKIETPYIVDLMAPFRLTGRSVVLDYGCGIGRVSRALIERYGCTVVGADISANMRGLAASYVNSERFLTCHPSMLQWLGVKFDAAIAVWVLQHCYKPAEDLSMIYAALKSCGGLFVLNESGRFIPTIQAPWIDDGVDVMKLIKKNFIVDQMAKPDGDIVPRNVGGAYYILARKSRRSG